MIARFRYPLIAAAALVWQTGLAAAQDYPNQTVQIVVPYDAGGGVDSSARMLAKKLTDELKRQFVVINKPGISGILGSQFVSESKPDGYTLLFAADTTTSAPFTMKGLTIDLAHDITPISKVVVAPFILVVNAKVPATNVKELVEYAKQHPADFRWGVGGIGTPGHLAVERFEKVTGIKADKIPYAGEAGGVTAILGGEVSAMLVSTVASRALVGSDKVRLMAILTANASPSFPTVPTLGSAGYPGFEAASWYGMWGPKGISPALVNKIHDLLAVAAAEDEFKEFVAKSGLSVDVSKSSPEFATYVTGLFTSNEALIKSLNLTPK